MSLLAAVNQPNKDAYYFALDTTPVDPTVSAPAFTATGAAGTNGSFTALADSGPAGVDVFNIVSKTANPNQLQWSIGMAVAPSGGNAGNDLAIYSYDDNGAFLGAPLQIDRSSGLVSVGTDLAVAEDITAATVVAGAPTTVGGGDIQVNGTLGVAQVYDSIYNRPNAGTEVINTTYGPTGTMLTNPTFTPANSGLHSVTMEVTADANGFSWTNGTFNIMGYFQSPFPPFTLLSDSFLACDSMANPTGMVLPVSGGTTINNVYKKDIVALVNLTAGTQYAAQINTTGAFNLGATGGIKFFIQPLLA